MAESLGPKGLSSNSKSSFKSIFPSDSHKSLLRWLVRVLISISSVRKLLLLSRKGSPGSSRIICWESSTFSPNTKNPSWQLFPFGVFHCLVLWGKLGKRGSGVIASRERERKDGPICPGARGKVTQGPGPGLASGENPPHCGVCD